MPLEVLVVDRGLASAAGVPLRDLLLVDRQGGARQLVAGGRDLPAAHADKWANELMRAGLPVWDVADPLPGPGGEPGRVKRTNAEGVA